MALTGVPFSNPNVQYLDANGAVLSGGKLYAFAAGTATPQALYTDQALTTPTANPVILDAAGRLGLVYLDPTKAYKFRLDDATDVTIWTADNVKDVGANWLASLGVNLAAGSRGVSSGYTIVASDLFITVDFTGGPDPCIINLPDVSGWKLPVAIQNIGAIDVAITPNGSDTINGAAGAQTLAAGSSPWYPTVVLYPDPANTDWRVASKM